MRSRFDRLDLNLLRVLVAIDRFRSVTEAGRHLSLSQPAASNALARLRDAFDDPLFVRGAGGLTPTPLAARIAPLAAGHLEALEAALTGSEGFDPASSTAAWRLSLSDLGEVVFLPAITDAVRGHGLMTPAEERQVFSACVREVLVPGFEALGIACGTAVDDYGAAWAEAA